MDLNQREGGDSYWVTSKPEHRPDPRMKIDWRWVYIHSAAVFEFSASFSVYFQQYAKQLCVYVCVCELAGNCFHVNINNRSKCWLCQHSLCFWPSNPLILSASFQSNGQNGWKKSSPISVLTTTSCCFNNMSHNFISISNKLPRLLCIRIVWGIL